MSKALIVNGTMEAMARHTLQGIPIKIIVTLTAPGHSPSTISGELGDWSIKPTGESLWATIEIKNLVRET